MNRWQTHEESCGCKKFLRAVNPRLKLRRSPGTSVPIYLYEQFNELRDERLKSIRLPYHPATRVNDETEAKMKALSPSMPVAFARMLLPRVQHVQLANARATRRIHVLQVIEGLRMHAAAHGKLPESFDQLTVVPTPSDPITGKAFDYRLDGATAIISSLKPGDKESLEYRVTLRP